VKLERIDIKEECLYEIKVFYGRDEVLEEYEKVYKEVATKAEIPGFRRGKVPKNLIILHFGSKIEEEVKERLIQRSFTEALKEYKFTPINLPVIEELNHKKGEDLSFKIKVEYKPRIDFNDYKSLILKKEIKKIGEEEVEERLRELQKMNATLDIVKEDREVREEDLVVIDYKMEIEGLEIEKKEEYLLELSNKYLLEDLKKAILGMRKGEEKEVIIELPEDFPKKEYALKRAKVKIKLSEIKERKLPNIDDEFTKDISSFNTLEEFKEKIRKDLTELEEEKSRFNLKNAISDLIISKTDINLPKSLLKSECAYLKNRLKEELKYKSKSLEEYLKENEITKERFEEDIKEKAIKRLKKWFILDSIAERENIKVTEEEIKERLRSNPYLKFMEEERLNKDMRKKWEDLREEIRLDKTLDFLIEKATIEEVIK
jgi:trigger factor